MDIYISPPCDISGALVTFESDSKSGSITGDPRSMPAPDWSNG